MIPSFLFLFLFAFQQPDHNGCRLVSRTPHSEIWDCAPIPAKKAVKRVDSDDDDGDDTAEDVPEVQDCIPQIEVVDDRFVESCAAPDQNESRVITHQ